LDWKLDITGSIISVASRGKLIESICNNPKAVRFADACLVAEMLGFTAKAKGGGSHHAFVSARRNPITEFSGKKRRCDQAIPSETAYQHDLQVLGFRKRRSKGMINPERYPAEVFFSDEDEGYIAIARDLPGCSAFGETQEEALAELRHAITAWQAAAETAGNPIPSPSKPSTDLPSGKILLRTPRSLHAALIEAAKRETISLNQYLVAVLSASTAAESLVTLFTQQFVVLSPKRTPTAGFFLVGTSQSALAAGRLNYWQPGDSDLVVTRKTISPLESSEVPQIAEIAPELHHG
jgi:predicted RNase H-like HicB family nuclease